MLRWRLLLGAIVIAALVGLIACDHVATPRGVFLIPIAVVLAAAASGEMLRLMTVNQQRPLPWVIYGGSVLVVVASGVPRLWPNYPSDCPLGVLGWPLCAFVFAVLLAAIGEVIRYDHERGATVNLALAVFGVAYVGLLMSFLVQLRYVGGYAWNTIPLISVFVVVKFCDIGAYTVGRLIGRRKLAPQLSPGKTVEGVLGGLAFACFGAWLVFYLIAPRIVDVPSGSVTMSRVVVYGVLLGAAGVVGDLAESLLKRDSGYKDSSAWLPGFGGILDMIDSLLVAAPVAYALWITGMFGPLTAVGGP